MKQKNKKIPKYLLDLIQQSPNIIYLLQVKPLKFIFINDVVEEITGYSPQEHYNDSNLGMKLVHPSSVETLTYFTQKALKERTESFLIQWIRKDGKNIWTEQELVPYEYNEKTHVMGFAHDVTEREVLKLKMKQIESHTNICSYCQRVQHREMWRHIENFIMEITGSNLTHGICPSCKNQFHPETD